jgi:hypothetical protein
MSFLSLRSHVFHPRLVVVPQRTLRLTKTTEQKVSSDSRPHRLRARRELLCVKQKAHLPDQLLAVGFNKPKLKAMASDDAA